MTDDTPNKHIQNEAEPDLAAIRVPTKQRVIRWLRTLLARVAHTPVPEDDAIPFSAQEPLGDDDDINIPFPFDGPL